MGRAPVHRHPAPKGSCPLPRPRLPPVTETTNIPDPNAPESVKTGIGPRTMAKTHACVSRCPNTVRDGRAPALPPPRCGPAARDSPPRYSAPFAFIRVKAFLVIETCSGNVREERALSRNTSSAIGQRRFYPARPGDEDASVRASVYTWVQLTLRNSMRLN